MVLYTARGKRRAFSTRNKVKFSGNKKNAEDNAKFFFRKMKPVERMQILNAKIFKNLACLALGVITTLHVVITIDQIAESPKVNQT